MTTVQRPNRDALQRALDIYRDAMRPFIVRCLKRVPGKRVEDVIQNSLQDRQAGQFRERLHQGSSVEDAIDINDFPPLLLGNWRDVFSQQLSNRNILNEMWLIVKARNLSAHPSTQDIEPEYTRTQLYHIAQVLSQINAPEAKRAVEKIRDQRFSAESATKTTPTPPSPRTPQKTRAANNLTPWREVIKPNADVSRGTFQEAEFAADLQQVYDGRASSTDYGNPVAFFNHTYITPGIRTLLVNTLRRLGGQGGDPVIQTKTGFGGGKTHSLIALYHLIRSSDALTTPAQDAYRQIRGIMEKAGLDPDKGVQASVAVLDGTFLATTDPDTTEAGDPLNTLWGVMAYQLGGQDAYNIIGQAARQGSAPGGAQLDRLFEHVGPCVILMDEPVAYVRNAGDAKDSIYTFMQALTQSVRRNDSAALVITLPESDVEAGGEAGIEALSRLGRLLARIEAIREPLEVHEAFEVVRRRLFDPIQDEAERDRTCEAFARIYNRSDYPPGVTEQRYLERMKACYPIHPEIFERLYSDWSSVPGFQRTRGVLRMMANCISYLYRHNDASPLILPGTLPLRDEALFNEFVKLLGEQWRPVLSEVDGDNSRPDDIDAQTNRFGAVGAAKRIARAVFLGSAPSRAVKGIDQRQIHLGVGQPGHGVSVYNEALNRMNGSLYYLYSNDGGYYFQAEENLNKVANDRADALNDQEIHAHIVSAIQEATRHSLDAIICPQDSSQVPEAQYDVRLVILPPDTPLPSRSRETDEATAAALNILQQHGDTARVHRNTLLFLAAKGDDLRDLKTRAKRYLAWNSIVNGEERIKNLKGDRLKQAKNSLTKAERELRSGLVNAYRQTMDPVQDDPQEASYRIVTSTSTPLESGDIVQSAFGKFVVEESLVKKIAPSTLANLLDRYVWNNESPNDHIDIDDLWEMMAQHVYLPRLQNKTVLRKCIDQGVNERAFGYAKSHDNNEYKDLRYGESTPLMGPWGIAEGTSGLLVNPTMAELVQENGDNPNPDVPQPPAPNPVVPPPEPDPPKTGPKQITVSKTIKTIENKISLDEINELSDEIIRNLYNDGGQVTVKITISAHKPDGFSENIASSIRENSEKLGGDVS